MGGNSLIRDGAPGDTDEIVRLCAAQYARTPWPFEGPFYRATGIRVCERGGRIRACVVFRREEDTLRVMHAWADDGFAGRRASLDLLWDTDAWATRESLQIVFDTMPGNRGLQRAAAERGYQSTLSCGAVHFRRNAWAGQP